MTAIIDCIKEWLEDCDYLDDYEIRTDYLTPSSSNNSFSLEQENTPNSLKKADVLGKKLKGTLNFILANRMLFNIVEDSTNNNNLLLMQNIEGWIGEQILNRNFPILNENEEIIDISIINSPYLYGFDKSMTQCRYQMSFSITYERRID